MLKKTEHLKDRRSGCEGLSCKMMVGRVPSGICNKPEGPLAVGLASVHGAETGSQGTLGCQPWDLGQVHGIEPQLYIGSFRSKWVFLPSHEWVLDLPVSPGGDQRC